MAGVVVVVVAAVVARALALKRRLVVGSLLADPPLDRIGALFPQGWKKFVLNMSQLMKTKTDLSLAGETDTSVDGMVAVARMATKGSSVVDAWIRSNLPVDYGVNIQNKKWNESRLINMGVYKKQLIGYVSSEIP